MKPYAHGGTAIKADPSLAPHGSCSTYTNWGCRCDDCREAWRVYFLHSRARRADRLAENPTLATHGRPATYSNWLCRCDLCTAAWATYCRTQRST